MKTQTNHKTFNKTLKKEIVAMFPEAKSYKTITEDYKKITLIYNSYKKIVARVQKGNNFKGLVIITHNLKF